MWGNYLREYTIQGRKLYEEIRYLKKLYAKLFWGHECRKVWHLAQTKLPRVLESRRPVIVTLCGRYKTVPMMLIFSNLLSSNHSFFKHNNSAVVTGCCIGVWKINIQINFLLDPNILFTFNTMRWPINEIKYTSIFN